MGICGGVGRGVKHSTSRLDIRIINMYRSIGECLITVDGILCLMMDIDVVGAMMSRYYV